MKHSANYDAKVKHVFKHALTNFNFLLPILIALRRHRALFVGAVKTAYTSMEKRVQYVLSILVESLQFSLV